MSKSLILHFRPRTVQSKALDFSLSFGLGGMAVVLLIMLFTTGILLKFFYLPFPDRAYESVVYLKDNVVFGSLIRNIHFWSANLLVIITFLHFLRVFFTSAFHPPRRSNWLIGLGLFLTVLLFNFSGYLLPWDQLSYWAVTICTGMMEYIPLAGGWIQSVARGGSEVGSATLTVFYASHTALLPCVMVILLCFHFWRIRKSGGLAVPYTGVNEKKIERDRVPAVPDLIIRETVTALVLIAVVLFVSLFFDAPLGDKANPGLSPNPTKAPWYFLGFQEILLHLHPTIAILIVPLLIGGGLVTAPFIPCSNLHEGVWFVSSRGRRLAAYSSLSALILTPGAVIFNEYATDLYQLPFKCPEIVCDGLMPLFLLFAASIFIHIVFMKKYHPDRSEKILAAFVFFLTVFILLTVTGIWFRGEGMELIWPM